jgi:NAD(P)-dependent dehydrogenase (short-subunit alcohol dehydrogenase family)
MQIPPEQMEICLDVLQKIASSNGTIDRSQRFNSLISKVYREGKKYDEREKRTQQLAEDRETQASTGMVRIQRDAIAPAAALPAPEEEQPKRRLNVPEACYICKEPFVDLHFFYHLLCPKCADYNWRMRHLTADLRGRTALVTGGRVKIGHQTVLRLLRDGAKVIVTTRFPHSAARRLYAEPDSADWSHRVNIYGLDLRNIPAVEIFARHMLENEPAIDILIHNAAQTIKRPSGFYNELIDVERCPSDALPLEARSLVVQGAPSTLAISDASALLPAALPAANDLQPTDVLPADRLEDNEERADSRNVNSWLLTLDQVSAPELLEVQLVNSIAPFILNARLRPLLARSSHERRFVVNVSAMEGQFARKKTIYHPHTNMAKAALNMMTRTSGDDYARDNIYMTSVDTGWVTDENPTPKRTRKQDETGFYPPLDIVDGMARIYHPIAEGINNPETPYYGVFLKDYTLTPW